MTAVDSTTSRYCNAKKRKGEGFCRRPAGWGTTHVGTGTCKLHGGGTPNHQTRARRQEALAAVKLFGARRDIHPAEALLELVEWTAGEVDYWRGQVAKLEEEDLTWGLTREKHGGEDHGKTFEAKPNIAYVMLIDASKRLESHCTAALRAGVSERLVQLAEVQGRQVLGVLMVVAARLGHDVTPGSEAARVILEAIGPLRSSPVAQLTP